jgi:cation/acetate symporter
MEKEAVGAMRVRTWLLFLWATVSFGVCFFARDLDQVAAGWPLNFWLAAQGGVLVFIGIVMASAWYMNRAEAGLPPAGGEAAGEGGDGVPR